MRKSIKDENGAILLEFAMVWPVMALIVFAGIEYSRCFRNMQMAASLSREAASLAYRDCGSDLPGTHLDFCVNEKRLEIESLAENLNEGSKIVISVFGRDTGNLDRLSISPSLGNDAGQLEDVGGGVFQQYTDHDSDENTPSILNGSDLNNLYFDYTRFGLAGGQISGNINNGNLNDHRRIVIAEAWVPFQPLLPGYSAITDFLSDNFYDSTVL
jgi:hypothetical protein